MKFSPVNLIMTLLLLQSCTSYHHKHSEHGHPATENSKKWLAGDHHIHSRFSVKWDSSTTPPTPITAGDAHYSASMIAQMASHHGLDWMVITDHGGPNHSKLNKEQAYPDLIASRKVNSNILQFYGMEFDAPGAQHASLIIPHTHDEADKLYKLENKYARKEAYPADPTRDTEDKMLEALKYMDAMESKPVIITNHPGRSVNKLGQYTAVTPTELRNWNDTAPDVAIGMEGSPGHQARTLNKDGSLKPKEIRGSYRHYPTMGGFDPMTAQLGGFWDSMLAEGRNWWITSSSDSHVHYTENGIDFWPGEYSKTYVYSEKNYDKVLDNLRNGHIFVTTGDLISELNINVVSSAGLDVASIGDTLKVNQGDKVTVSVKFLDPETKNAHFDNPSVNRVDLIIGQVNDKLNDKSVDTNPSTIVAKRFTEKDWQQVGPYKEFSMTLKNLSQNSYIRVRGTNTNELEPEKDLPGSDPWSDLWFYSNPIFIDVH